MPVKRRTGHKRGKGLKETASNVASYVKKTLPEVVKTVGIALLKKQLGLGKAKRGKGINLAGSGIKLAGKSSCGCGHKKKPIRKKPVRKKRK